MINDKDIETAPTKTTPTREEYMSAPQHPPDMFPHEELTSRHVADTPRTATGEKKMKIPKWALIVGSTVVLLIIAAVGYFLYVMNTVFAPDSAPIPTSIQDSKVEEPKNDYKLGLTFKLFVPSGENWERPLLYVAKDISTGIFTYSTDVKFGQGITKGTFGYSVYPKAGSSYNPPSDCGIPGQPTSSKPVPCTRHKGSYGIPAYIINGQATPGGITNTSVTTYISLFAEREGSVIVIESADISADDLYALLQTMQEISPDQIPQDSVQFYYP